MNIFQQMSVITSFTTEQSQNGSISRGFGKVLVDKQLSDVIVFNENGQRQLANGSSINFTNTYSWRFLDNGDLSLSHLRHKIPVHLLDFEPRGTFQWYTKKPHFCGDDIYSAMLTKHENKIHLQWIIQGPKKAIKIDVAYT